MAQQYVSVSTSAGVVVSGGGATYGNETVIIMNPPTSGGVAYIGGSTVTTATGFALTPGSTVQWYNPPAACYGITASGSVTLTVTANIS